MDSTKQARNLEGNEVVISGMSGLFPKSDSVLEFMENLYNNVDMVMEVHTNFVHPNQSNYLGKINGLDKFDAQFFKVIFNQAMSMDPMCRKLMEQAYSAIYDAGINPLSLSCKKIGVYVGICYMDSTYLCMLTENKSKTHLMSGCSRAMLANRISFFLNTTGPSYCVEGSSSASLLMLDLAYKDISSGRVDGAIVAGSNVCNQPSLSINLKRAGLLCKDGRTKCFDKNGDGSVRSEAISVLFLQKAKDAKRIYCEVYGTKTKYSKPDIHCPLVRHESDLTHLLEEFYSEIDIEPSDVEFVEANATGIATNDEKELKVISTFFGNKSKVRFGSVKSNMGHSEGAAGMCALTKVCLAYHTGQIAANINCFNEMENKDNVILVKENTTFQRGLVAINDLSYTGIDCHALIKGYFKPKDVERYKSNIPYLIFCSGRQEICVDQLFDFLQTYSLDPEYIGMLHNIHNYEDRGHTARGYIILDKDENKQTVTLSRSVGYYSGNKRQVWFVFSGMGSQWAGMGADLMRINIFSDAIKKCDKVLKPKNLDIIGIITEKDKTIFNNILNSFVGIAAVQIGLIDILRAIGIECDYMIGHSVGELGCGYADGCFTTEEMILSAYYRGVASLETNFIQGAMAAVGLGYKELSSLCPPDIDIACHNSSNSSTISGPAQAVSKFVEQLNAKGVFSKEVPTSNIAYHSRYIAPAGPTLRKHLDGVIKEPKLRSNKWLSTSVTEEKWHDSYAKYSSSEYFTNNLLNNVYFEETSKHIPSDAILIEVAPHGLLQAILKRCHEDCLHIPLTKRGSENQVKYLLDAIGKMYEAGVNIKIDVLYPKIEYPVSTGTPFLSHLVKWEHSEDWPLMDYSGGNMKSTRNRNVVISVFDENYISIQGNIRNSTIVFPESALLVLTWETLAMSMDMNYKDLPVKFSNLKFHNEINVNPRKWLKLSICITKAKGRFEVLNENEIVVSGFIKEIDDRDIRAVDYPPRTNIEHDITLYEADIYKFLSLRCHVYKNEFRSIYSMNIKSNEACIKWTGDWITFLDGLIQINVLANNHNGISKPKLIQSIIINVLEHSRRNCQFNTNGLTLYNAQYYKTFGVVRSGGVEITNISFDDKVPNETDPDFVGTKQFWPHFPQIEVNLNTALYINLQIIANTATTKDINVTELNSSKLVSILATMKEVSTKLPINIIFDDGNVKDKNFLNHDNVLTKSKIILTHDILQDSETIYNVFNQLPRNGFIMALEKGENKKYIKDTDYFNVITAFCINATYILVLLKKVENNLTIENWAVVKMDNNISCTKKLDDVLKSSKHIILLSELKYIFDFSGYLKSLQGDCGRRISLFSILDTDAPKFDVNNDMYRKQLLKNLTFNTLYGGEWGGYYYTSCEDCNIPPNITLPSKGLIYSRRKEIKMIKPKNTVQVQCTSLSVRDAEKLINCVSGKDISYGMDFSGFDKRGNRVMGLVPGESNSREIEYDSEMLWPVPDHWTLEEAAIVPLTFVHAYYCLVIRSNLRQGQTVFINGGAGALGQAVIAICLSLNCDVYTSVTDMDSKINLLKLFPTLDENKILNSVNSDILGNIIAYTNNKRCDIVVNTERGASRESTMTYVGFLGQFLDMTNHDAVENNQFGFGYLKECKNYIPVDVWSIFRPENSDDKKVLQLMIAEGISKGIVRPFSYVTFSDLKVSRASRLLVSGRQRGRVIIKLRDQLISGTRLVLSAMHTYVVIGDQDELCVGLVSFLVKRGAKTIFLNLEHELISPFLKAHLNIWKNQNVVIEISYNKINNKEVCNIFLNNAIKSGSIEGIFILLNNSHVILNLKDDYNARTSAVINLDKITRDIDSVRYFAVLTMNLSTTESEFLFSVYSKICQYRKYIGLPALLYRAEFVDEVYNTTLDKSRKLRSQKIHQVLNGLEKSILKDYSNVISFNTNKNVKVDYLNKLADIIDLDLTTTFNKLDQLKVKKIRNLIQDCYEIDVPIEELKEMSLLSIQNIDQVVNKFTNNGLNAFIYQVEHNPYEGTEAMKPMITLLNDNIAASELQTYYEMESIDSNEEYLLLIPGFEGHHRVFESLCLNLKFKAMTIPLGSDFVEESITKIAEIMMKNILFNLNEKKKFYLLGYSFGINVALEFAALLEKKGLVGVVICLDTSPEVLRTQLNTHIGNLTDTELQNTLINHIYYFMTKDKNNKLSEELVNCETFDEKANAFIKAIKEKVSYPQEYIRLILELTYKRILLAQKYNPTHVLESELVLIKGTSQSNAEYEADYSLSKFSKKAVKVFNVDSDHAKVPFDVKVPAIINSVLNVDSIKIGNTCEKYILEKQ